MPRVYLTERAREIARLKRLISFNLKRARKETQITQEEAGKKYGTSAPSIRKVERGENVGFPYEGLLNLILDSNLTIVEVEK